MAESRRDPDPTSPQNPPEAVVNKEVRKYALWTYLPPLLLFFAGVAALLVYWNISPPTRDRDLAEPRAEGTAGIEGERGRAADSTPGGHDPNPTPSSTQAEVATRMGDPLDELGALFQEGARDVNGRRIVVSGLDVERVDGPTVIWVRDGNARAAVVLPDGHAPVKAGQKVDVTGVAERFENTMRIRATRVDVVG